MKDVLDPAVSRQAPIVEKSVRVRLEPAPVLPAAPAAEPAPAAAAEGFASNRKLIRPSLTRSERAAADRAADRAAGERGISVNAGDRSPLSQSKKPQPPEQTYAEPFYFQKQMQTRTPMVIVLTDGEELRGVIEWYDKDCIKLNRSGPHPNLLVYKAHIKYVFKDEGKR